MHECEGTDVVVRATLAGREDCIIHALLQVRSLLRILPEEDEARTWTTERLVTLSAEGTER